MNRISLTKNFHFFITESSDIVITILSQQSGYHIAHAELLKNEIFKDAEALDQVCEFTTIF